MVYVVEEFRNLVVYDSPVPGCTEDAEQLKLYFGPLASKKLTKKAIALLREKNISANPTLNLGKNIYGQESLVGKARFFPFAHELQITHQVFPYETTRDVPNKLSNIESMMLVPVGEDISKHLDPNWGNVGIIKPWRGKTLDDKEAASLGELSGDITLMHLPPEYAHLFELVFENPSTARRWLHTPGTLGKTPFDLAYEGYMRCSPLSYDQFVRRLQIQVLRPQ